MKNKHNLRDGFTTGTAATAATMAAFNFLINGMKDHEISVPLPPFYHKNTDKLDEHMEINPLDNHFFQPHDYNTICTNEIISKKSLKIPILRIDTLCPNVAQAEVEKDGGDDPDVTKHAHIIATVSIIHQNPIQNLDNIPTENISQDISINGTHEHRDKSRNNSCNNMELDDTKEQCNSHALYINIDAEDGIGRVTMPGLAIPVGYAAINPVPRLQIACALYQIATQHKFSGHIEVRLRVPDGQKMAKRTLNARLGIIGGISILGTHGIVKPYSNAAWKDTILKCLDMASQINNEQICFCTGRRSERLIMQKYPILPAQSFIQSADFVGFSLEEAHKRNFKNIVWACFFGKFVKLAEGHFYTHARSSELNMNFIVRYCEKYEASCTKDLATCLTAAHALELLLADAKGMDILQDIAKKAAYNAQNFAKQRVYIHLFHLQGHEILSI